MSTATSNESNSSASKRFEEFMAGNSDADAFRRLQSVVDNLGSNVLISNAESELVYMNKHSEEDLQAIEDEVRDQLGGRLG